MERTTRATGVAYEPCATFSAADDPPLCAGCGWAEDDHRVEGDEGVEARSAGAVPLLRAS